MKWLLLCLHLFFFHFPFSSSCHPYENYALLHFKSSFTLSTAYYPCNESPMKTTTWQNGSDCCSWHGVTCDTISSHVIGLNLGCEGLTGILYSNSSIFHLSHLQTLNLSSNYFSNVSFGSQFHSKFGGFQSLTHLDLSNCDFQGEVPPQISHLSKLTLLRLSDNSELIWKETTLKRLVQNATNLREMFLDGTNMSSIRPNFLSFLFDHSSFLVTLNLKNSRLRGDFKQSILCLPAIHELYMSKNNLTGQLPEFGCSNFVRLLDFSFNGFQGHIPLSFSNLTSLTYLSLTGNSLNGELPLSISNLQHLIFLDLSSNSFIGQIPDVFGGMTKIRELYLYLNNLEGQIPSSLFNLNQLVTLDCSDNNLVGPLINRISGFRKLTYLILHNNLLNGTIPSSLLSLPRLEVLHLANNRLTGPIRAISLYSLEELYLCQNKLQDNIPKSLFSLPNITILCLSSNNLTGVVDFHHFSKLQNLHSLSLSHNSQLSLKNESKVNYNFSELILLELSSLSLNEIPIFLKNCPRLYSLDMSNNKLNGRVPDWLLETMNSIGFLNLSQNMFTSIDQISTSSYRLGSLDLSLNLLHGELSSSICNMSSLQYLNLAQNKLTGTIPPCLVSLSSLRVLDLQMNNFYGILSNKFSKDSQLLNLNLYGNQLEDQLPKTLSHCKNLEVLNLGSNRIEDNFPYWLQTLENLKVLVLRDNKLHGPISNLRTNYSFPNLMIFYISSNNFSGLLPRELFKKFEAMKDEDARFSYMEESLNFYSQLSIIWYYDSVTLRIKGINSILVKISTNFATIDMSRNKFEGDIPNAVGELHALIGLNLSHNRLSGSIPRSMANLINLESLDLSSNMITGVIPAELSDLNFLEFLDVSNNHLVGDIPQGKQFNTFSNDSFEGNLGLCGVPLSKKCRPEQHSPFSPNKFWSEEKFGFGWKPVAIGYGCGFVFGIGLGYCMFLIGKPRWLVMIFGGQPKRKVRRRTRVRRTNHSNMNQMIQMS
ncbi:receptor like protein 22-like [Vicia villosa]|uniref:receptor like protein 22-like n=1 Tax=Vicia villosa TaxID=3911 RepID=UPI00273C599A|nr:receptor like protein 22-like [Vicia villosa]